MTTYKFDPPHTSSRKLFGFLAFIFLVGAVATAFCGCTATQKAAWRTFGVDALKCAGTGVLDAAGDAMVDLLDKLAVDNTAAIDPAALGKSLAIKYGSAAALCAVGKLAADLLPAAGLHAAPTARARVIQQLLDTQKEWAK